VNKQARESVGLNGIAERLANDLGRWSAEMGPLPKGGGGRKWRPALTVPGRSSERETRGSSLTPLRGQFSRGNTPIERSGGRVA